MGLNNEPACCTACSLVIVRRCFWSHWECFLRLKYWLRTLNIHILAFLELHLDFLNRILLELKRLCVFFASSFPHKDLWILLEFLCTWIVIIALTYPAFQQGSPRWKTCTVGPRALFAASRRDLALRTWSLEPSAWYSRDYQPSWFRLQKANCPVADSVCENTLCIIV